MIEDIDDDIGSANCLKEMLQNNVELLRNGVRAEHIALFLGLIRTKGMKPKYLKLLLSIAATRDEAVQSKQNLIYQVLLRDNPMLLVHSSIDDSEPASQRLPISERNMAMYSMADGGEVWGNGLLHTVNHVMVRWESSVPEFSIENLYNGLCCGLVLLDWHSKRTANMLFPTALSHAAGSAMQGRKWSR